jgi:hypothetical protein
MKRQIIAVALGSLFALPALANNEIDAGNFPPMAVSAKSVEQVRADLIAAQRAGTVMYTGAVGAPPNATPTAGLSRGEVVAFGANSRRTANYMVTA